MVTHISLESCEDSVELWRWAGYSIRVLATEIDEKFFFLSVLPWRFAEPADPPQA